MKFFQELGMLLNSGLDLKSSLDLLRHSKKNDPVSSLAQIAGEQIVSGKTFYEALQASGKVSNFEVYSCKIGEQTGRLSSICTTLSVFYEKKIQFKRKLINALTYPVLVLFIALGVLTFMLYSVVPMFSKIYEQFDSELPASTQHLIAISNYLTQKGGTIIIVLLCIGLGGYFLFRNPSFQKKFQFFLLRIPFVNTLIVHFQLTNFTQSMGIMLNAKIPIDVALNVAAQITAFFPLRQGIEEMIPKLVKGLSLSQCFKENPLFTDRLSSLIRIGESVNKLDESFASVSTQLAAELENKTANVNKLLEPFLIILISFVVGGILLALYVPLFNLSTTIE